MITGFAHQVQLSVFVKAVGMGYFIGIVFSFFAFMNILNGRKAFPVFVRDIIFFILCAFITFMFSLKYNAGMLRFYIFAGELMGFMIFYIFPGRLMSSFWKKLLRPVVDVISKSNMRMREKLQTQSVKLGNKAKLYAAGIKNQVLKKQSKQENK